MRDLSLLHFVRELVLTKNFTGVSSTFSSSAAICRLSLGTEFCSLTAIKISSEGPRVTRAHSWPSSDFATTNYRRCTLRWNFCSHPNPLFFPFLGVPITC